MDASNPLRPRTVDLAAVIRDAVTEAVHDAHRALALADETLYTIEDVLDRVPWSRSTVDKMVRRQQIPMRKVEGRWVITAARFREAAAAGFPVPSGRVQTRRAA
jgi:Mg2+/Co2+ transporter CorC